MGENTKKPTLWIIVPCYNEEAVLPITAVLFKDKLYELINGVTDKAAKDVVAVSDDSRVLFVNDGSADSTWNIIQSLSKQDKHFIGISQSRNRGHQNAVLAGLMEARQNKADITISIDCDGQDDINAMNEMVASYYNGYDVVYGVRKSRKKDSFFKKHTAHMFYKLMNLMGAEVVYDHADYRLVSSKILDGLADFKEVNLFLRGLIPLVGYKSTSVYYERNERIAGKSHYPICKMLGLAFDGITSLSIRPIRLITSLGMFIALLSFIGVVWSVVVELMGKAVTGWASMTCIICFIGGIQLICMGVIGEYIGKIYMETKERPRYIISERTWEKDLE